jgi:putative intracellular protease/amidase
MAARILIPLPDRDFEPTEVGVPWWVLTRAGHEVVFATERGARPTADPRLLEGVVFGQLGATDRAKSFHDRMIETPELQRPLAWADGLDAASFDAILLPGGHAQGMKQYLDSPEVRAATLALWKLGRPVAAICHGVLVLARTIDPATGKSVLAQKRTTCLPKYLERNGWLVTFWKLGRYYRTYDTYVEDEVRAALADPEAQFDRGPLLLAPPGTRLDDKTAFVVEDGPYLSARWPGDATLFAKRFCQMVEAS